MSAYPCGRGTGLNLHASTGITKVERDAPIPPDILLGYRARLRFDLDLVGMVVAPCGAVAPAYGALAEVDMIGQPWHGDRDGAAVTGGVDWGVIICHLWLGLCETWLSTTSYYCGPLTRQCWLLLTPPQHFAATVCLTVIDIYRRC